MGETKLSLLDIATGPTELRLTLLDTVDNHVGVLYIDVIMKHKPLVEFLVTDVRIASPLVTSRVEVFVQAGFLGASRPPTTAPARTPSMLRYRKRISVPAHARALCMQSTSCRARLA